MHIWAVSLCGYDDLYRYEHSCTSFHVDARSHFSWVRTPEWN